MLALMVATFAGDTLMAAGVPSPTDADTQIFPVQAGLPVS